MPQHIDSVAAIGSRQCGNEKDDFFVPGRSLYHTPALVFGSFSSAPVIGAGNADSEKGTEDPERFCKEGNGIDPFLKRHAPVGTPLRMKTGQFHIAGWTQEKLQRVPCGIDSASPVLVRNVAPSGTSWCDRHATALDHHFFQIPIAEPIAQIPAYAQKNDPGFKLAPFARGLLDYDDKLLCSNMDEFIIISSFLQHHRLFPIFPLIIVIFSC